MTEITKPVTVDQPMISNQDANTEQVSKLNADETAPNLELLLFLAEWDEFEDDQWIDPEAFSEDSAFNQQLDNKTAKYHEKDPHNH